jgi:hypothetical protein
MNAEAFFKEAEMRFLDPATAGNDAAVRPGPHQCSADGAGEAGGSSQQVPGERGAAGRPGAAARVETPLMVSPTPGDVAAGATPAVRAGPGAAAGAAEAVAMDAAYASRFLGAW